MTVEALRRAGQLERIDEDRWKIPKDVLKRGQAYDLPGRRWSPSTDARRPQA